MDNSNFQFSILLVDDMWQNRTFLVNLLEEIGFSVSEANDGKEALELAAQQFPDIILTDLVMPVMDGFELTREIRKSADLQNTVVIAASANVFEHQQRKSSEAGCNEFMAKPIDTDKLLALLPKYLPLEWVYDNSNALTSVPKWETPAIGPSSEQASVLFKLIMSGNIKKIIENVTQLEQQNAQLSPFAEAVRNLTNRFEMSKLKTLVKPYINCEL